MAYNTNVYFIVFLPIVIILYQITPKKFRYITLLISSIVFFALISKWLIIWAILAIIIAYLSARFIEIKRQTTNKYSTLKCIERRGSLWLQY